MEAKQSHKKNKFRHPDCVRLAKGGVTLSKPGLIRVKLKFFLIGVMVTIIAAMMGTYAG